VYLISKINKIFDKDAYLGCSLNSGIMTAIIIIPHPKDYTLKKGAPSNSYALLIKEIVLQ